MDLLASVVWLIVVVWLIARALRQRGVLRQVAPRDGSGDEEAPKICVIIPARDEALNIRPCVASLIAQTYPAHRLRIIVVDDHSSDGTGCIVAETARTWPRLELLETPPLPPGWVGKSHACWIGACAVAAAAEWLCFMDADIRAEPGLLAAALSEANASRLDFLSLAPRQELLSFAERLVMPCGLYLLAFRQDLRRIQAPDSGEATATGQFLLIRRSAYEQVGGHAAVHADVCEDVALARLMKQSGYRVALADGNRVLTTRMYTGWHSLWIGVSKNLVDMLGGPASTVITALLGTLLAWTAIALPLVDLAGCAQASARACAAVAAALPASAAAFGLHLWGASFFRIPLWYGLLFPLGYTAGAAMALDSVRRYASGRRSWKGRTY